MQLKSSRKYNLNAKPFLKWAGGKSQLLEQMTQYLPDKIDKYIEPFIGSGAVFIHIAQLYNIESFYISDINEELILAYKTIQKDVEKLIKFLLEIQEKYLSLDEANRKKYYYHVRTHFNQQKKLINFQTYDPNWIERTAQIIFLNRTCFNGLFRVNSKDEFNVPMGKYKNPVVCNVDNLRSIAKILKRTQIELGDFTQCEKWVDEKTFVYFDPPYRPLSKTANFTSYSKQTFDDKEQLRLRDFYSLLDKKGAKLMLSNSDPKNEDSNDNFFEVAYEGYRLERVLASRSINSNAQKRGKITEIVIMNYK